MKATSRRLLAESRLALNPIQWMATDDGWLDPALAPAPERLLAAIRQAGFDGVMAQVPPGCSVDRYRQAVATAGLTLAPGYFVCRSDGRDDQQAAVLAAAQHAAAEHAELGLGEIGLGLSMGSDAPRVTNPACRYAADSLRLESLVELIAQIGEVMTRAGVRPCLHPHVGTWIESEEETRVVLDAVDAGRLGFLPDTGHLSWAGADVAALIAAYADRIPFVHVKDCRMSVAAAARNANMDYRQTVVAGLWVEPGRGELALTELLAALPSTFSGWLMVEVDRPDLEPFASAVASARWMREHFGVGASASASVD